MAGLPSPSGSWKGYLVVVVIALASIYVANHVKAIHDVVYGA